ncbi:MAG: hypothetical protein AAF206_18480, partial [Bacteroidota bacterium]
NMDFEDYLANILRILRDIQEQGIQHIFNAAKDIPVFHLFPFPELARFKMFFWQKTIYNDPSLEGKTFSLDENGEKLARCVDLCRKISEIYSLIPATEIWNVETTSSFLKQIDYYYESGLFSSAQDALTITMKVEEMMAHIRDQAARGYKFLKDSPPSDRVPNFELFFNELVVIDNVFVINFGEYSTAFLVYNSIEYLSTQNPVFCARESQWLENLTARSQPISKVGERERNRFFRKVEKDIAKLKQKIQEDL